MADGGKRRDLYEVLEVSRDADEKTLRQAYRRLARRYHPDVNPGDAHAEERFKEISKAWAVLSDPEKRRLYDEFGEVSLEGGFDPEAARRAREAFGARFGAGGAPFGAGAAPGEFDLGDLDDLLGQLFDRGAHGPRPRRGADLAAELSLDFLEAARGGERRISVTSLDAQGRPVPETLTVRIPPGVADGGRIRLAGKGAPGRHGGTHGDLYATVRVRPHRFFRREGRDVFVEVPISVREAILGGRIEVPTLSGRATVTVPPGSDSGRKLRLRGKGIADPRGGRPGDLFVELSIRVPRDLDPEAREAIEKLPEPSDLRKELLS